MTISNAVNRPSITLSEARSLIKAMAAEQSLLFLSPPGVGKSDTVVQAAKEAGMSCRSLLGTQIAPEDVSGIPRIVGERSVFCPPRLLLPESPEPFCLFLDELPACSPDIQKAFYSLLLERRIGEFSLPPGTWVVAAGNRMEDRALVRAMSSALINRVIILNIRVDVKEWQVWAARNAIRSEILMFITWMPEVLARAMPAEPLPFSTPRAWAALSRVLDAAERAGSLSDSIRRALAFGAVSAEDANLFCTMIEEGFREIQALETYILHPETLPKRASMCWFVLSRIRSKVARHELNDFSPEQINHFLRNIPRDNLFGLLLDLVPNWGELGAADVLFEVLGEVTGL